MDEVVQEILSKPFSFVLYHVGGGDDAIGPATGIMRALPDHALLVVFEIRSDNSAPVEVKTWLTGQKMLSVNMGVDIKPARRIFNINKFPKSSSLFKSAPMARDEDTGYLHSWGVDSALDREILVDVMPLDQIIVHFNLPKPDFLSIDAQGAELNILKGAEKSFADTIIGAVSEVEFSEIYAGQALFDEQMAWYMNRGMRLAEISNQQRWHPGPRMPGKGFLTVGEAVFIKYVHAFEDGEERPKRGFVELQQLPTPQLLKLMAAARGLELLSYATKLAQYLMRYRPDALDIANGVPALKECLELGRFVSQHYDAYRQDKDVFMNNIKVTKLPKL